MKNKILHYKIKFYAWLGNKRREKEDIKQINKQIVDINKEIKRAMLNGKSICKFYLNKYFVWEYWTNKKIVFEVKEYFTKKGYKIIFDDRNEHYIISWEGK